MARKTAKTSIHYSVYIACILLCLTLISLHMTGGLYAKYFTTGQGSDSARVIRFGALTLTESGDFGSDGRLVILPGVDLNKKAVVDFGGSEASVYVFVEAVLSDGWSAAGGTFSFVVDGLTCLSFVIEDGWTALTPSSSGGTYVFYCALAPNTPFEKDVIKDGKVTVSENITSDMIGGLTGISITLRAAVVQSGGFASPAAAWASISA